MSTLCLLLSAQGSVGPDFRLCHRCNRGAGLQARANLNVKSWTRGLSSLKESSQQCNECAEDSTPPRTGLNGAGSRAGQTSKEAKGGGGRSSRTNLNGGELVQSTFLVLTFAFALAFMATFVLALILAFLSPLGAKSLPFWGATVKKEYLGSGWYHPLWSLWLGLCPCPW